MCFVEGFGRRLVASWGCGHPCCVGLFQSASKLVTLSCFELPRMDEGVKRGGGDTDQRRSIARFRLFALQLHSPPTCGSTRGACSMFFRGTMAASHLSL